MVDFLSVLVFVSFFVAFFVGTGSGAAKAPVTTERRIIAGWSFIVSVLDVMKSNRWRSGGGVSMKPVQNLPTLWN